MNQKTIFRLKKGIESGVFYIKKFQKQLRGDKILPSYFLE